VLALVVVEAPVADVEALAAAVLAGVDREEDWPAPHALSAVAIRTDVTINTTPRGSGALTAGFLGRLCGCCVRASLQIWTAPAADFFPNYANTSDRLKCTTAAVRNTAV
jgi:hypothetical protein